MSQPTYCHCTHCGRESNPVWARKYDGLCLDCYNAGAGELLDRITKLEAKLAEAVELLRPFADESNEWISWVYDECNPVIGEQGDAERAMFTVGDLRKAAAFVAENGKVKS